MDEDFASTLPRHPRPGTFGEPPVEEPVRTGRGRVVAAAVGLKLLGVLFFAAGPCFAWLWLFLSLVLAAAVVAVLVARGEDP